MGFTGAALLLAPVLCAFAFRKLPHWHGAWLPSLLTLPAILLANIVFSTIGDGAATRAGSVVAFAWIAFVGAHLLAAPAEEVPTAVLLGQPRLSDPFLRARQPGLGDQVVQLVAVEALQVRYPHEHRGVPVE